MKKAILFLLATACTACVFAGCSTDTAQSTVSQETVSEAVSSDTTVSEPESIPEETPAEESSAAPLEEAPAEETTTQTAAAQPDYSYNTQTTADPYADWVPYHTSSPTTLAQAMANGYVVYHNGQYLASPYYFKMLSNQTVVYFKDISPETESIDRFATANQSISDYHLNSTSSYVPGSLTGITSALPKED